MPLEVLNLTCSAQGSGVFGVESPLESSGTPCCLETSHAGDPSYDKSKKSEEKALQAPLLRQTEVRAPLFSSHLSY